MEVFKMQLVATLNASFFRAITVTDKGIEIAKDTMLQNQEGLEFQVMTDEEFETWLMTQ